MQLRAQKRQEPWTRGSFFILVLAVGLSLLLSGLLLQLQGKEGLRGIGLMLSGGFGSWWALQDSLVKAVPIFLCAVGIAVTFRLQIWNIGAEGQFALGAVGATWAALTFPDLPGFVLLPIMFLAAALLGGLWGFIPGIFKTRLKANEIIVTLMLNYVGILFLEYLVYGRWKDKTSFGFPMTAEFGPNAVVGRIPGTDFHWGVLFCLVVGVLLAFMLKRTILGFELKVSGEGVRKARYSRMSYAALVVFVLAFSGAMAGTAGFFETSAVVNRLQPSVMVGYGYTAIVVAWLARLHPLTIGVASFLLAGLRVGVENLQLELQVPAAFGSILEGMILLLVLAGQFFRYYTLRRGAPPLTDQEVADEF
ncbi:MAG: ABC transporter permease [Desulfovibrionales bacterium]